MLSQLAKASLIIIPPSYTFKLPIAGQIPSTHIASLINEAIWFYRLIKHHPSLTHTEFNVITVPL